jgi:predicted TPR repeat methyltransferase
MAKGKSDVDEAVESADELLAELAEDKSAESADPAKLTAEPAAEDPRAAFVAKLRDIRARVEHHAHRAASHEVKELGYAVRDLIDLVMT